ncbi:hypothetical protein ES705_38470 [subsurface metagenome]
MKGGEKPKKGARPRVGQLAARGRGAGEAAAAAAPTGVRRYPIPAAEPRHAAPKRPAWGEVVSGGLSLVERDTIKLKAYKKTPGKNSKKRGGYSGQ